MDVVSQTPSVAGLYNDRLAVSLGLVTLIVALATFASCRSFIYLLGHLGLKRLTRTGVYQFFYRFHTFYWFAFGVSVVSHMMMAVFHTGLPQAGDPDAGVHWVILAAGFTSAMIAVSLFLSCRVSLKLVAPVIPGLSFTNDSYKSFFRRHSYYWWLFILLVGGHFMAAYLHVGIWPRAG